MVRARLDIREFLRERELPNASALTAAELVHLARHGFSSLDLGGALAGWGRPRFVFRGQLDESWGLTSTLAREVSRGDFENVTEARLCLAERRILKRAREHVRGVRGGSWLGRNMTDGELLAVLQHQEAPTRFLDVTEDPLVALYFACEKEDTTDGRLFVIGLNPGSSPGPTTDATHPEGLMLDLSGSSGSAALPWPSTTSEHNSNGAWTNAIYLVDAGSLDPRMRAQRGLFIVGGIARAYSSYTVNSAALGRSLNAAEVRSLTSFGIGFRTSTRSLSKIGAGVNAYSWSIRVPGAQKPAVRRLLAAEGIHRDSLFPEYREFKRLAVSTARLTR